MSRLFIHPPRIDLQSLVAMNRAAQPAPPDDESGPNITRYIVIAIALVALAGLIWLNREVVVLFFGAVVFATVLRSLGELLSRFTHLPPRWGVIAAVVLLVVILGLLVWGFGASVASQFTELRQQMPKAIGSAQKWLEQLPGGASVVDSVQQTAQNGVLEKFGLAAEAFIGGIANLLLIVFAALYLALDRRMYRQGLLRLLPVRQRPRVSKAVDEAGRSLAKWLHAQLLLMAAVGALTWIGLAISGVPLALSLALIAGILEFIPVVGPIVAAVPGILLAFTKGPEVALYALIVYVVVQQVESNLLTPLIQRWAVELPPVVALFSILIGGLTFGMIGVVFATPLAVVAMVLIRHLYVENTLEK